MGRVMGSRLRWTSAASGLLLLCHVHALHAAESASAPAPAAKNSARNAFEKLYREIDRIDLLVKGNARYVDLAAEIRREEIARTQQNAADAMLTEVTQRTQELDQLQKSVDTTLALKSKQQELGDKTGKLAGDVKEGIAQNENLKLLMGLYESVKPGEAAELLKRLPLPVAVTMIEQMPPRKASKILSAMDPKFAADVSRRIIHGGETIAKATAGATSPSAGTTGGAGTAAPAAPIGAANAGAATAVPPSANANAAATTPPPNAAPAAASGATNATPGGTP